MPISTEERPPLSWVAGTERLTSSRLKEEETRTRATPRRSYGVFARLLFWGMDLIYGTRGDIRKFRVLEVIARMPYQAWENVAYIAITHVYSQERLARRIFERVQESRLQQDNEQWHLLILGELIEKTGVRRRPILDRVLPQLIAFTYYHLSWLLFVIRPRWSYEMNADFEDHAEHEYMSFVADHPELETVPFESQFEKEFGSFSSLADVFRQIGYDERVHKIESLVRAQEPRFS